MHRDLIEELYRNHYKSAFAYVFSLCRNTETTEDIVNQAFEKAILTVDDSVPHFRYWLMRVCKNLWLDMKRREKKISQIPIEALNIVAKDDVLKEVISHIENIELYGAIAELDETEREIVGLFYFSNLSIKEIARLTGLSTTNTKVKLHRSRLRLKKKMEERDDF